MKANTIKWYIGRLLAMSISELVWRIRLLIKIRLWKVSIPNYSNLITRCDQIGNEDLDLYKTDNYEQLLTEAEKYLNHEWLFFGLEDCSEKNINWHLDPVSQKCAPLKFGFDINHRDENIVGNIKNTWEKNRHHHLTILAEAYYITQNEKYAIEIDRQLRDWIKNNPYLIGVNWTHPLEQGVRLISWVYIYKYLKDWSRFNELFGDNGYMWRSIYEHQKFIEHTYSRGSSANNHLIGEMAGLFIASCTWPVFKESNKWKNLSHRILENELIEQNFNDGINKELGFSYQIFVAQFAVLCIEAEDLFSVQFNNMLRQMIRFISGIEVVLGTLPNYGDGDEGMALQLDPLNSNQLLWLNKYARKYLNLEDEITKSDVSNLISKESGIAAFSKNIEGSKVSVLFDFGPLGMGSMAAHGHADALSFVMNVNSHPFFVDTGTYCYHDDLMWRSYFRSTKAHNTINIDDKDQSVQSGPFLWSKKAMCTLENLDSSEMHITASHDGYENIGVKHIRSLSMSNDGLSIEDVIEGENEHKVEIRFHLHPSTDLEVMEEGIMVFNESNKVLIRPNKLSMSVLQGENDGGWYSPKFGIKIKTKTIVLSQTVSLPASFKTRIEIQ